MIQFTRLRASHAFAYRDLDFTFKAGIHSICGVNGAAKSSLFHTLCHALYNKNPKGCLVDEVSNAVTGEPYEITVDFTKGEDQYQVFNSRRQNQLTLKKNGVVVSPKRKPDTLAMIEEVIGLSYVQFVDIVYRWHGSSLDILDEGGDTARKRFIARLLPFEQLDEWLQNTRASLTEVKQEVTALDAKYQSIDAHRMEPVEVPMVEGPSSAELQKELETLQTEDAHLVSERKDIQREQEELVDARARYEKYIDLKEELARYATEPEDVRAQIEEAHEKLRHLERRETELAEAQKQGEKRQRFEQEYVNLEAEMGEKPQAPERSSEACSFEMQHAREEGETVRKELAQLQQSPVETACPTCERPYDNEEELRVAEERRAERIETLSRELERCKTQYIRASAAMDDARLAENAQAEYVEQQNELKKLHARIDALTPAPDPEETQQVKRDIVGARMFLKSLELRRDEFDTYQRLKERRAEMGEVAEPRASAELDKRLEDINQRLNEIRSSPRWAQINIRREQEQARRSALDHNEHVKKHNRKLDAEAKELKKQLKDLRAEQEVLYQWETALGQKGFRLKAIQEFLDLLNARMQVYSAYLSESRITCRFYLTEDDKIDYQIQDSDKEVAFRLWSEGEKSRIKLACLFAVIDLLETIGGVQVNLLFLDEIFGTLDEQGRDGLFNLLADLKTQGKSVFTIAHTPVANPALFDSVVEARKEHGVSVLEII